MLVARMTVRDIMQTDVTTVSPGTTVRELTRLLSHNGISGVPVVTAAGGVAGVVSSTDIVRLAADESELRVSSARWMPVAPEEEWTAEGGDDDSTEDVYSSYFLPEAAPPVGSDLGDELGDGTFDEFTVADIMTPVSFSVPPTASIQELAQFLLRGRIHRAVVTEDDHLVGIVTTMDILRAVAEGQLQQ